MRSKAASSSPEVRLTVQHRDRGRDGTASRTAASIWRAATTILRGGESVADERALQRHHRTAAAQRLGHLRM
jgi:hypothetical protein